jgi:hypothetical protein
MTSGANGSSAATNAGGAGASQLDMCLLWQAAHGGTSFDIQSPGAGADSVLSTHNLSCPLRSFIVPIVMGHFYPLGRFQ